MKKLFRVLLLVSTISFILNPADAQTPDKEYYQKFYSDINNKHTYVTIKLGYIRPTGLGSELPKPSNFVEDPFIQKAGLGLKNGFEIQGEIKSSFGKPKSNYAKSRIMYTRNLVVTNYKPDWTEFNPNIKISNLSSLGFGYGLESNFNYANRWVLGFYYKLIFDVNILPDLETEISGNTLSIISTSPAFGYNTHAGVSLQIRKHLVLDFYLANKVVRDTYTISYEPDIDYEFKGGFDFSRFVYSVGYQF